MPTKPSKPKDPVKASPDIVIDSKRLQRSKPQVPLDLDPDPPNVSAGPIDKFLDLAFNASRDKIREFTVIDRMQGRLLPQLDLIDLEWQYAIEVSAFRQDSTRYAEEYTKERPVSVNLIDEYTYRVAQWQKSIEGRNLDKAMDVVLAEAERQADEDGTVGGSADAWKE